MVKGEGFTAEGEKTYLKSGVRSNGGLQNNEV